MKLNLILLLASLFMFEAAAQKRKNASEWIVIGNVINSVTRHAVSDTIKVSIVSSDTIKNKHTLAVPSNGGQTGFYIAIDQDGGGDCKLVLSHPDYATAEFPLKLTKKQHRIVLGALPIRKLTLAEKGLDLDEVAVVATKVKFFHKGDTLVFNADAFNLAEGSMLDALIDQLPGVELDANGVIKVNGKPVESLLLNGKDFFKGNNSIMLENLPAYTVKNVKVFDYTNEDDARKGIRGKETFTMDIVLKKEFSKSVIANAEAGIGTHGRYTARAFGLLLSDRTRLSAFAKINNTNEYRTPGRNGNWDEGRTNSGQQIIREAGFDYGIYGPSDKYRIEGNANVAVNDVDRTSNSFTQNFLPEGDTYRPSFNRDFRRNVNLNTYHLFLLHTDSINFNYLQANIQGQYQKTRANGSYIEATFNQNPEAEALRDSLMTGGLLANSAVNRILRETRNNAHTLYGKLYGSGFFGRKGSDDFYGIGAGANGSSSDNDSPDTYQLYYGKELNRFTDRLNVTDTKAHTFNADIYYAWCPNSHIQVTPQFYTDYSVSNSLNDWFITDRTAQTQSEAEEILRQLDPENSYRTKLHNTGTSSGINVFYNHNRTIDGEDDGYIRFSLHPTFKTLHSVLNYDGIKRLRIAKDFKLPSISALLILKTHRNFHYFDVKYDMNTYNPSVTNLIDITFTYDPLIIRSGNPALKNYTTQRFQANYRADGLYQKGMMISAQIEYNNTHNAIAMATAYDRQTGIKSITPININGNWNTHARSDMSFPLTRNRKLTLGATLFYEYSENVDMTTESSYEQSEKTTVFNHSTWDILSLEYKFGSHRIKARGELSYNHINGSYAGFDAMDIWSYNYGLNGLVTMPREFQLSTDIFIHSKRGYADSNANYNSLVWNATLSKSLFNGTVVVKLDAFDILHQVRNTSVSINANGRVETTVNTIPAYYMLRIAYNFSHSPHK